MFIQLIKSKSIWGAWLAFGFGVLVLLFASTEFEAGTALLLLVLALTVPTAIGLFIKWADSIKQPPPTDLNPDIHFVQGFFSQFGGIILWLLITSRYGLSEWFTDSVNLSVFLGGTAFATLLTLNLSNPPQKEED